MNLLDEDEPSVPYYMKELQQRGFEVKREISPGKDVQTVFLFGDGIPAEEYNTPRTT